ncbi:MAG: class I SAM-dependent methyltransferase [Myxococcales bacterium]
MSSSGAEAQRRHNESEFHDRWAAEIDPTDTLVDETFTSITAVENQHILAQFGDVRGKRILDYGCGAAEGGVFLAKQGARVVGIDVSAGMLGAAQRLAARHGVEIETRQVTSDLIPAGDQEFDLIYGNGVLHHVSLPVAIPELARVMKPGGKGCFIEPLPYNPVINVYRRIAREVRTPDEKPLTFGDIERFRGSFGEVSHQEFWLTTLSVFLKFYLIDRANPNQERYWKKIYTDAGKLESFFGPLRNLDERLLKAIPPLRRLCWNTVITVAAPRRG